MMRRFLAVCWLGLGVLFGAACDRPTTTSSSSLVVYCAAGIRHPVTDLARHFEQSHPGVSVQLNFGGSGTMLAQLALAGDGDLYVAADSDFMEQARGRGLVADWVAMAHFRPVLAVPAGNPAGVRGLDDVSREGVRFGIGDVVATAVGALTKRILEHDGTWSRVADHLDTTAATVNELATALAVGSLDAAVIWNATASQNDKIDIAATLGGPTDVADIPIAVLNASSQPELARAFQSLAISVEAASIFRQHHFEPATHEQAPSEHRELVLFCGGSMRRPIEELLPAFERKHNVTIHRQYNGCGILVGQMKAGMPGDVYYSCDQSFMDEAVAGGFCERQDAVLTMMSPVIVVPTGNPKNIRGLADLARPGLRVVLGNEQHGAVGRTAYRLLEAAGLREKVEPNIVKTAPTADLLLTDIAVGTADAGIVWDVVARGSASRVEMIQLPADEARSAMQPVAVMSQSKHPDLSAKLVAYLRSDNAREVFDRHGFGQPAPADSAKSDGLGK